MPVHVLENFLHVDPTLVVQRECVMQLGDGEARATAAGQQVVQRREQDPVRLYSLAREFHRRLRIGRSAGPHLNIPLSYSRLSC